MPVRCPAPWFEDAVHSILNQDLDDFELIIVDDGSENDSEIRRVAGIDRRMRLVRHHENRGVAVALNTGLALARAPFVARMDADDVAAPDRLRRQVEHLEAIPSLLAVGASYARIDAKGRVLRVCYRGRGPIETRWALLTRCAILHPTLLVRRNVFDVVGYYDSTLTLTQDLDFFLRLTDAGDVMVMSDVLLKYRVHDNSQTRKFRNEQVRSHIFLLRRYWERRGWLDAPSAEALASLVQSFLAGETCGAYAVEAQVTAFQNLLERFVGKFQPDERAERRIRADATMFLLAALARSRKISSLLRHLSFSVSPRSTPVLYELCRYVVRELAGLARGRFAAPHLRWQSI